MIAKNGNKTKASLGKKFGGINSNQVFKPAKKSIIQSSFKSVRSK